MPSPESQVKFAFFVKPADSLTGAKCHKAYSHQQIVGVAIEEDEYVGHTSDIVRRFTMPSDLAYRIIDCAVVLHNSQNYNCHRFSRVIAGLLEPEYVNGQPEVPGLQPPLFSYEQAIKKTGAAIDLGAVGVIGTFTPDKGLEIPHSVIGLGGENEESLQFTCHHGMMSLVRNADLLDFYRSINPTALEVDLWQLDPTLSSSSSAAIPTR
jgi:hypothetical protein